MDIDLELPSSDHERLGIIESRTDGMDVDQTHGEGRDANSPVRAALSQGMSIPNTETGSVQDQMDIINVEIDHIMGPAFEPKIGLEFESKEEAYSFYREYARFMGFGITIKASRRSKKSGKFIDIKIACSRFGSKRESTTTVNPRPCLKTGCDASMHIKKRQDGKWYVHGFIREHNHEICPDDFHYALKGKNQKPGTVVSEKNGLQLALDDGDVQLMLERFMDMQETNPNFFYAVDFDREKQLRSVLWVDAKARHDYKNFSDVIFFDTYYISNGYKIPFVPIVGVNHHYQYVLFGGALIGDMATSSFIWLMKTWLKAVGRPAPRVVVTDQEQFLKEAVADVFPNTTHLFSLWHILTRVPEKLGKIIHQNRNFMESFNKCVYRSWTDEEFEKRWWEMIDKFEIRENEWLQLLFDDHKKWVPTYVKNYFLAGMSTNERSASVASSFDKYICKETIFKEFVEQSENFSKDMLELEGNAEFETRHQEPALKSRSPFEKQMATIYVTTIFKKFQLEVLGAASCQVHKQTEDGAIVTYQVDDLEEQQNFLISGVTSIPHKYILKRWTRSAKVRLSESSNRPHYRVARFNNLCKQAINLSEVGSLSQETYDVAFEALEEVLKQCVFVNNSNKSFAETNTLVSVGFVDVEENDHGEDMAKSSRKKKTTKKGKITKQARYKSSEVEVDSRAAALDGCHSSQQNMQGSVREHAFQSRSNTSSPFGDGPEGYYNLQAMQSLDQSPSVVARVGPRSDGQTIQSLGQLNPREPGAQGRFDIENNLQDMEQLNDALPDSHNQHIGSCSG